MNRPYIQINVAMTADGKIDLVTRNGASISSKADICRVDELRASVDAVMVGGHTLLSEDPDLTVKSMKFRQDRVFKGLPENPAKIGIISEIPVLGTFRNDLTNMGGHRQVLQQFLNSGPAKIFLFTSRCNTPEVLAAFENTGAKVQALGQERVDLEAAFQSLYQAGINSVLVEGGGTLIAELFRLKLVDELTIYIAPMIFGGHSAPTLADGNGFPMEQAPRLILESVEIIDELGGILVHYFVAHEE
jgi:2,5-diamino-6-(ribosylamino)-4(3H)-pyrimidinone 5'-phosphate reductase